MRPTSSWKTWHKSDFWKLQINRQEGSVTSERNRPLLCRARQAQQKIPSTASSAWVQFLLCTQTISLGGLEVPLRKGLPGTQWLSNRSGCNYSESSGQKPGNTSCLLGTLKNKRGRESRMDGWRQAAREHCSPARKAEKGFCLLMTQSFQRLSLGPSALLRLMCTATIKQETHTD